ncbi:type II toxin-antitoxin system RelE/ParE family toxin [Labrys monachus]|uniref:Plasmid stabilization system protein ParE n=1 Tax=Labrys monachus TaxID=217067 RepID=A0ABU0FM08_9HYPH|nr:type II toxin-antitoxin system RelE/ParE family toxin [Labrys monachus]MDQ0395402.1 plasmid stabilization system protein ParE [Labrys monachus]
MKVQWTEKALLDLARLHDFLAPVNRSAAERVVKMLSAAPTTLSLNPRIGNRLEGFAPREVRRIVIQHYEMRYEIRDATLFVLRLWHTREDR